MSGTETKYNDPELFEWEYSYYQDSKEVIQTVYCRDLIKSFPYNSDKERDDF